jgi:hypothetical protein
MPRYIRPSLRNAKPHLHENPAQACGASRRFCLLASRNWLAILRGDLINQGVENVQSLHIKNVAYGHGRVAPLMKRRWIGGE